MRLIQRLRARATGWATEITKLANQNLGNKTSLILVKSKTVVENNTVSVLSTASPKNKRKPVARAYEYGSGIYRRSKKRSPKQLPSGRILIKPRPPKKYLAFSWQVASSDPESFKMDNGKVLLRSVAHPGVKAANGGKGYLSPAITKVRRKMRRELKDDVAAESVGMFRKAFKQK